MADFLIILYGLSALIGCLITCATVRDYARAEMTKDSTGYSHCILFERRIPKELILVVTCLSTIMAIVAVIGIVSSI